MAFVLPPDLTAAQSALSLDQQLFPGKPIYNTGHFLTIRGPLRFDLFEQALRADFPAGSFQSLRIPAVAAGPAACGYAGIVAAPQATTESLELSILVQTRVSDAPLKADGFC
jgi:hypothetical protein